MDWLSPLADIAGSAVSSAFNVHESRQNRRFQRDMSNSAHQREMVDLRKAGLNPILSAKLGGSSTPSGTTPEIDNPGKSAGEAYTSAKQTSIQGKLAESSIGLQSAQAVQAHSAASLSEAQANDVNATRALRLNNLAQDLENKIQALQASKLEPEQKRQQIMLLQQQVRQARIAAEAASYDLSEKKVKKALFNAAEPVITGAVHSAKHLTESVKKWWNTPRAPARHMSPEERKSKINQMRGRW